MAQKMLAKLRQWMDARHTHASSLFQAAEEAREAGDYSDLEALEQSIYNQAVLDTLTELRGLRTSEAGRCSGGLQPPDPRQPICLPVSSYLALGALI